MKIRPHPLLFDLLSSRVNIGKIVIDLLLSERGHLSFDLRNSPVREIYGLLVRSPPASLNTLSSAENLLRLTPGVTNVRQYREEQNCQAQGVHNASRFFSLAFDADIKKLITIFEPRTITNYHKMCKKKRMQLQLYE